MRRLGLLAMVLASYGSCAPPPVEGCTLDRLVDLEVEDEPIIDCGSLDQGTPLYEVEAIQSARLCVLNAIRRGQGFRLVWDGEPGPRRLRAGLTGVVHDGALRYRSYAYQGGPIEQGEDSAPTVALQTCAGIVEAGGCTVAPGLTCLTCVDPTPGMIVCGGQ